MKIILAILLIIGLSFSMISYNSVNFVNTDEIIEPEIISSVIKPTKNININLNDGFSFSEDHLP